MVLLGESYFRSGVVLGSNDECGLGIEAIFDFLFMLHVSSVWLSECMQK